MDILDKPDQLFNCDETGFSRKECSVRSKVFGVVGEPTETNEVKIKTYKFIYLTKYFVSLSVSKIDLRFICIYLQQMKLQTMVFQIIS